MLDLGSDRLCVPDKMTQRILEYGHDNHAHGGIHRTYDRPRSPVSLPKMRRVIQDYIDGCPACQLSKPSRRLPYGQLQSGEFLAATGRIFFMDFIVGLPFTPNGHNCILTVTDKYFKYVHDVEQS